MTAKQEALYNGLGEFFREAAVLVVVFGNLDPIVHSGSVSTSWVLGTMSIALLLLFVGLGLEMKAAK